MLPTEKLIQCTAVFREAQVTKILKGISSRDLQLDAKEIF